MPSSTQRLIARLIYAESDRVTGISCVPAIQIKSGKLLRHHGKGALHALASAGIGTSINGHNTIIMWRASLALCVIAGVGSALGSAARDDSWFCDSKLLAFEFAEKLLPERVQGNGEILELHVLHGCAMHCKDSHALVSAVTSMIENDT